MVLHTAVHDVAACILPQVTEAQLADLFKDSGKVVDCRVCGDPNSAMRFAFIEFAEDDAVQRVRTICDLTLSLQLGQAMLCMDHADVAD